MDKPKGKPIQKSEPKGSQPDIAAMMARLEERISFLVTKATETCVQLKDLEDQVAHMVDDFEDRFVLKAEFAPVRSIVYGIVGIILVAVAGAVVALVVK